jgi:hypothetical protein
MARAIGSAGERLVHTEEVTGSIPVSPTQPKAGSESRNRPSLSSGSSKRQQRPSRDQLLAMPQDAHRHTGMDVEGSQQRGSGLPTSGRTKITKCLGVLGGRPAEQQPGHPPRRSGGNHRLAARHAGPPCLQEQAVPFAGPLRIVLHSLRDVLVDHGRSPRQRLSLPLRSALALTLTEHESCSGIHPQHCPIGLPRALELREGKPGDWNSWPRTPGPGDGVRGDKR